MKILNKKTQKRILLQLAANHLIAKYALDKLGETTEMTVEDYCDATQHLIENTSDIAKMIAGMDGIKTVRKIIESTSK